MTQKIGFNREKLRRFTMKNSDLQAASLRLYEDINFLVNEQIPTFERQLKDACEKIGLSNNREIFNARHGSREPAKHMNFMDYPIDQMLESYKGHPIKNYIDYSIVQRYVRFKNELEALINHRSQINEELKPRIALVSRSIEFLKSNGLTTDEIGLGVSE